MYMKLKINDYLFLKGILIPKWPNKLVKRTLLTKISFLTIYSLSDLTQCD